MSIRACDRFSIRQTMNLSVISSSFVAIFVPNHLALGVQIFLIYNPTYKKGRPHRHAILRLHEDLSWHKVTTDLKINIFCS